MLFPAFSQDESPDYGLPEITNYFPKDWKGSPNCWSIVEDDRGVMYFGIDGIVEYDGVNWKTVKNSNESLWTGRVLEKDTNGRIYAGGVGDLGYLHLDPYGQTEFLSLKEKIPQKNRDFQDVWRIFFRDSSVYFMTIDAIFRHQTGMDSMQVFSFDELIVAQSLEEHLYVFQWSKGLQYLQGDTLVLAPGGDFLKDKPFMNLLPFDQDRILIITKDHGLYLYNGQSFEAFAPQLMPLFTEFSLAQSARLKDGTFAILSQGGGIFILNRRGELVLRLTVASGLGKENGQISYVDSNGELWAGMAGCISRISLDQDVSFYDKRQELGGIVLSTLYTDGFLYVGSGQGLQYFDTKDMRFKFVEGTIRTNNWALCEAKGEILAGNNDQIFRVEGTHATPITNDLPHYMLIFDFLVPGSDSNLILCGGYHGLAILRWQTGLGWQYEGMVQGFDNMAYKVVEHGENTWWASSVWHEGVHKISFPHWPSLEDPDVIHFGEEQGIDKNAHAVSFEGQILSWNRDGLVHYDEELQQFVPDSTFDFPMSWVIEVTGEKLWMQHKEFNERLCFVTPEDDGNYRYTDVPFKPGDGEYMTSIFVEPNGYIAWLGTSERLVRYDTRKKEDISSSRSPIFSKIRYQVDSLLHMEGDPVSIPFKGNRMRFEYTLPVYDHEENNTFSTWMEGQEETWSDWSNETYKEFMNLPEGDYTFHVKARNHFGEESGETVYLFTVLPPWWQSWWAYGIYAVIGGILLFIVDRIQRKRLLKKEWEKAREKELAYSREIKKAYEELKATQAQLIQSEKMASLGEMTAGIAHEIQNPLNFVNNFSEINKELLEEMREALDRGDLDEAVSLSRNLTENEEKVIHHGKRADGIVKSMLQHSRGSSGQKEPVNLNILCDEYLRLAYHGLRAKDKSFNAEFETVLEASLPEVEVVPQDIGRVLLNLINNAFYAVSNKKKKMGAGYSPKVTVTTRTVNSSIEIVVKDNGEGIPQEIADKIFQPFFTTKPTGEGTGLGLSLAYDIVTKGHNGDILIHTANGKGTEFVIRLPV